jgi:ABC-type dipeptide/oligopeptide/nickel transport system permease component
MRAVLQGSAGRWSMYVGRRLVGAALTLFGVVVLVFVVTRLLGDPVQLILGPRATPEQVERLRAELGYDQSILAQFWTYLGNLLQGDLGVSRYTQRSVSDEIASRFPSTIELATAGMLLGLLWTIPLGIISALRPRGYVDRASQFMVEFGVAIPSFWLGLLLVLLFVNVLGIAPTPVGELDIGATAPPRVTGMIVVDALLAGDLATFRDALAHLALPAITLAITSCPPILQLTRNTMIGVLRGDFVRSARSLGLPERTVRWYAFKNALLPVSTMTAMTFGFLLGGTVLVETVFSWPGIGLYAIQSMQRFDYEPVLGIVLLASAVYVLVYFLADLLAMVIDPRVRESV